MLRIAHKPQFRVCWERSLSATTARRSTSSPIEAALKRVKDQKSGTCANMFEAARVRVSKLEEFQGSISQGGSATCQSRRHPGSSGRAVTQCQQFIDCATKRMEDLDRAREIRLFEGGPRTIAPFAACRGAGFSGARVPIQERTTWCSQNRGARCCASTTSRLKVCRDARCSGSSHSCQLRCPQSSTIGRRSGKRIFRRPSRSGAAVRMMGVGGKIPLIEGTSLALFHFRRQNRHGLRGVRVGEASHPGQLEEGVNRRRVAIC